MKIEFQVYLEKAKFTSLTEGLLKVYVNVITCIVSNVMTIIHRILSFCRRTSLPDGLMSMTNDRNSKSPFTQGHELQK